MHRLLSCASVLVFALGALAAASPAAAQVSPANEGKKAEEVYKNIKALRGTPANELNQSMHLMKGAVGLDCIYCHIEREWEKDVKPAKEVARAMIVMMNDINTRQFGGKQVVTCNTCHNGHPTPAAMPVFPVFEPVTTPKPALPTADQILAKYVQALGGEQALRKVTTRTITGTQYIPTGPGRRRADAGGRRADPEGAKPCGHDVPRAGVCDRGRVRRHDSVGAESGGPRGGAGQARRRARCPGR